ncbi:hypothetical protein ACUNV4_14325 [Granulosicoccus sp. 3-233]|uniref:hypothetical protein n=1 Tax=Granulosicoccus sp. 3-233 TaxID=3417969 RepID=UPI003D33EF55
MMVIAAACHPMRYPENAAPDPTVPYGETMHDMLTLSMVMSIVIGICLYIAGRHGRILWMKVWSIGLIACSLLYLLSQWLGWNL